MEQPDKAKELLRLHSSGQMLVLPNIWNPIGARALERTGYPAVATASAAVSASLGFADGERINKQTLLDMLKRISSSVGIPVTADIERGYGNSTAQLNETIKEILEAGIVGINLEDSIQEGGELREIDEQCERISAIRETAVRQGIHLVINARIDSFLSSMFSTKDSQLSDAVTRAKEYEKAGADCVYPIGPGDHETIKVLRENISLPINILVSPGAASLSDLRNMGINRVSFGPFIFRSCFQKFLNISRTLIENGGYDCFLEDTISGTEINGYLNQNTETQPGAGNGGTR